MTLKLVVTKNVNGGDEEVGPISGQGSDEEEIERKSGYLKQIKFAQSKTTMFKKLAHWFSGGSRDDNRPGGGGGIFGQMTPEALCEIDPDSMDRDQIRIKLAELYKGYNQAAGSLNPELREEAGRMLEAIVHCREKYVDVEN
tara:strand:+ start:3770 stop:4195 length:426 start_codon:yes stop_codon:yes gene_type:complete